MEIKKTTIEGLLILEPRLFKDSRGYFTEIYHKLKLAEHQITYEFLQDNQSRSTYGVIRGLHFQKAPYGQTKLIRVLEGNIFDVAVDIRPESATYGQWFGLELSAENHLQLLVPAGLPMVSQYFLSMQQSSINAMLITILNRMLVSVTMILISKLTGGLIWIRLLFQTRTEIFQI